MTIAFLSLSMAFIMIVATLMTMHQKAVTEELKEHNRLKVWSDQKN